MAKVSRFNLPELIKEIKVNDKIQQQKDKEVQKKKSIKRNHTKLLGVDRYSSDQESEYLELEDTFSKMVPPSTKKLHSKKSSYSTKKDE